MNKRGYFFSMDAFIALLIILGVVLFVKPPLTQTSYEINIQEDLLDVLSNLNVGEINNTYTKQLINSGDITNLNQSVLEQIGEFYANSDPEAQAITSSILNELNLDQNLGIYFNDAEIASIGTLGAEDADTIDTSRQIISGIINGTSAKGYSSRAFLFSENKVDYFYFGGYIGDGNISVKLGGNIIGANMEGVFSHNFSLYINDQFVDDYCPVSGVPLKVSLSDHLNKFSSGDNYLDFKSQENLYIAGGYIRAVYNSSSLPSLNGKHGFPGVDGLINLYDSFYVPGNLDSLEVFLHYDSEYNIFMTIGNTEIYRGNSSGFETSVTIDDATLDAMLDYGALTNETIPIRIGLENVSHVFNFTLNADVFSVTDLSGSMREDCNGANWLCCFFGGDCSNPAGCADCGGTFENKIGEAITANKAFVDAILNSSGDRVGLVGYREAVDETTYHELSNDNNSLKNKIDTWTAGGNTCICCGINRAVDELVADSNDSQYRSIVVMSDGQPNVQCARQGTGSPTQDAIEAACDAYENYGIVVHAVGFGSDADETTLQNIAVTCGHGNYYYGGVDDLTEIYEQVAQDIIEASYYEQTVVGEGIETKLYSDSYIDIGYDKEIPYGLLITSETEEFGDSESIGDFFIPNDTEIYEVKVISYSGSKWTSRVENYDFGLGGWSSFFDLGGYNSSFVSLGDPYVVNIPLERIFYGNNSVRVSIGLNTDNYSAGSENNKVIYSLVKDVSSFSPIVASAQGCNWNLEFEDGSNLELSIPSNYSGSDQCYYNSTIPDFSHAIFNNNDAIDYAIFNLLSDLDLNSNGKIETKFSDQDLTINSIEIEGIPFTWETEVQVRAWR